MMSLALLAAAGQPPRSDMTLPIDDTERSGPLCECNAVPIVAAPWIRDAEIMQFAVNVPVDFRVLVTPHYSKRCSREVRDC
jgi:hypothetical protein